MALAIYEVSAFDIGCKFPRIVSKPSANYKLVDTCCKQGQTRNSTIGASTFSLPFDRRGHLEPGFTADTGVAAYFGV